MHVHVPLNSSHIFQSNETLTVGSDHLLCVSIVNGCNNYSII